MRSVLILILATWFFPQVSAQNLSWNEFNPIVKASLRGLSPVSENVCWASGAGGTWLKTTDGGKTWESGKIAGLDTVDFRSIQAWDEQVAVVASAGQPAVIYRTTDGGKTWAKVHQEGPEAFFDAIAFAGKKRGFVLGDPVDGKWMILQTKNGGNSWKMMDFLPDAFPGEAAFAASSSSMISGPKGVGFATGGSVARWHFFSKSKQHWTVKVLSEMAQGESAKGVFAVVEVKDHLVMVGGDYTLLKSREGNSLLVGNGSNRIPERVPMGYRSGVTYWKNKGLLLAVGPSGSDYSLDSGQTWESFSEKGYHAVKVSLDGKSVWASGSGGRLAQLEILD
ncbi:WD40/YVTN/BNR-like repeat-containing protein [Algoriphagus mannitolivorans]|uniref:WD40/YVTN/BNR-like repeat-containing protein n=1 Tax=Algoriphagus mannitolivorans TaxID=226504 RepID=UPI000428523C|nr:YCF48-related protein [Algoriphagus mannitolivorans]